MNSFENLMDTNPGLHQQFASVAKAITEGHEVHDEIATKRSELHALELQAKGNADKVKDRGKGLELVVAHHQALSPLAKVALLSAMDYVNIEGDMHNPAMWKDGEQSVQQVADEFDAILENLRFLETGANEGDWPIWYLQLVEHNQYNGRFIEISDHTVSSHFSAVTDNTGLESLLDLTTSFHFRRAAVRFGITGVSKHDNTSLDLQYESESGDKTEGLLKVWHPGQIAVTGARAIDILDRSFPTMQAGFFFVGTEAYGSAREYLLENVQNVARYLPALSE